MVIKTEQTREASRLTFWDGVHSVHRAVKTHSDVTAWTDVSDGNKTAAIWDRVVRYDMTVLYYRSQYCGNVHDAELTM